MGISLCCRPDEVEEHAGVQDFGLAPARRVMAQISRDEIGGIGGFGAFEEAIVVVIGGGGETDGWGEFRGGSGDGFEDCLGLAPPGAEFFPEQDFLILGQDFFADTGLEFPHRDRLCFETSRFHGGRDQDVGVEHDAHGSNLPQSFDER